jgi:hypothetical protein
MFWDWNLKKENLGGGITEQLIAYWTVEQGNLWISYLWWPLGRIGAVNIGEVKRHIKPSWNKPDNIKIKAAPLIPPVLQCRASNLNDNLGSRIEWPIQSPFRFEHRKNIACELVRVFTLVQREVVERRGKASRCGKVPRENGRQVHWLPYPSSPSSFMLLVPSEGYVTCLVSLVAQSRV